MLKKEDRSTDNRSEVHRTEMRERGIIAMNLKKKERESQDIFRTHLWVTMRKKGGMGDVKIGKIWLFEEELTETRGGDELGPSGELRQRKKKHKLSPYRQRKIDLGGERGGETSIAEEK